MARKKDYSEVVRVCTADSYKELECKFFQKDMRGISKCRFCKRQDYQSVWLCLRPEVSA